MSKRIDWIDISKGIAIILVVIGHNVENGSLLWNIIFSFHMPFFFFASGFLFKDKQITSQLKDNCQRLLLPYISTLLFIFFYTTLIVFIKTHVNNLLSWVLPILYSTGKPLTWAPSINVVGAMWFLTCLFCASIIFNTVIKLTKSYNKSLQFLIIVIISLFGYIIGKFIYLPWSFDIALASQFFIYCGYYFKTNNILNKKPHIIFLLLLSCLLILSISTGSLNLNSRLYNIILISYLGAISGCILLVYFSMVLTKFKVSGKVFSYLGKESLVILCFHFVEQCCIPWTNFKLLSSNIFVLIFCKLVFLIIATYSIKYIPIVRNVFYYKQYSIKHKTLKNADLIQ